MSGNCRTIGQMDSVSFLIAAYNEEESLSQTVERCRASGEAYCRDYEIVILNDCSTDRTAEVMEQIRLQYPDHVRLLHHEVNKGIGRTFEDLFHAGQKEWLLIVPGDGQYPPEAIKDCIPIADDLDLIVFRRTYKHYTLYRHIISFFYTNLPSILFMSNIIDSGTVKCVRKDLIEAIPITSQSVFADVERVIRAKRMGYRVGSIDIEQGARTGGKACGASLRVLWPTVIDVFRTWWKIVIFRS